MKFPGSGARPATPLKIIPGLEGATCDPLENNSWDRGRDLRPATPSKIILSGLGGSTWDPVLNNSVDSKVAETTISLPE